MNKLNKVSYNPKHKDKYVNSTVTLFNGYIDGFNGISMLSSVGIELADMCIDGMACLYSDTTRLMWEEIGKCANKHTDLVAIVAAMKSSLDDVRKIKQIYIDLCADLAAEKPC